MKTNKLILFLLIHKNYKDLENFLINQLKEKTIFGIIKP